MTYETQSLVWNPNTNAYCTPCLSPFPPQASAGIERVAPLWSCQVAQTLQ